MKPQYLVIHHSYSEWGDVKAIDSWHKQRGWSSIGYHKVILNGFKSYGSWAKQQMNCRPGDVQQGRPDNRAGAHAPGFNNQSLGICLIGNFDANPPCRAMWDSLVDVCSRLCLRHNIPYHNVIGHRETYSLLGQRQQKSCPGRKFSMASLRKTILRVVGK